MLEHRDVSQGDLGREAGCIREHRNAMPTAAGARTVGVSQGRLAEEQPPRGAKAGNPRPSTDAELELSILWRKPRVKGRMRDSTDKTFKARTQRSHL